MKRKGLVIKLLSILSILFVLQTTTFYMISVKQLKKELLPSYFRFPHKSDSAYVRDFAISGEDILISHYLSHNLRDDPDAIKDKLNVGFIYFEERGSNGRVNEGSFNLLYNTWVHRGDWYTLSNLYQMRQTEEVIIDKNRIYTREVIYRWCLFFWIKTRELIQTDE